MTDSFNFHISFADASNTNEVSQIEKLCFSQPWSQKALDDFLSFPYNKLLCAFDGKKVCGYITFSLICGEAQIENVAVAPDLRKKGIADKLLQNLVEYLVQQNTVQIFLEVRVSNTAAICLYKKHGFTQTGCRKGFYSFPKEDGLVMSKKLTKQ